MPNESELAYGHSTGWQPERPRIRVFSLIVGWRSMAVALMVVAGILPGVHAILSGWRKTLQAEAKVLVA